MACIYNKQGNVTIESILQYFINRHPIDTGAFHSYMMAVLETIQFRNAIISGINVENSRISERVGLPRGPVRIHATIFFFVDIQSTGNFQKVFHTEQLLYYRIGRRFARDNTDFATRAIHKRCDNMLCSRANHLR